jgi:antitoxin (DNA-binding transcriptional repressor) of toxin-antitoxin stability system
MLSVSVRELKGNWSTIEAEVINRKSIKVTNRGRPTVRLEPPISWKVLVWDDHLRTAVACKGNSGAQIVVESRERDTGDLPGYECLHQTPQYLERKFLSIHKKKGSQKGALLKQTKSRKRRRNYSSLLASLEPSILLSSSF